MADKPPGTDVAVALGVQANELKHINEALNKMLTKNDVYTIINKVLDERKFVETSNIDSEVGKLVKNMKLVNKTEMDVAIKEAPRKFILSWAAIIGALIVIINFLTSFLGFKGK